MMSFDELDIHGSFKVFESVVGQYQWPHDLSNAMMISLIVPKLTGETYKVYSSLVSRTTMKLKRVASITTGVINNRLGIMSKVLLILP